MPVSDDDETYPDDGAAPPTPTTPQRAVVASRDPDGAQSELEAAQQAYDKAQNELADLEGQIVVLDFKVDAVEADESTPAWQQAAAREELAKAQREFMTAGRHLERVTDRLQAAEIRAAETTAPPTEGEPPRFATVEIFVDRFVLPNWVHKFQRVGWCDKWWEHAEAITRFEAMWEAFEVMRLDPAPSFSTWLRDHFDVHMRTLTDPDGVFYNCDVKKGFHQPSEPWPHAAAPAGMFATIAAAQVQRLRASPGSNQAVASTTSSDPAGAMASAEARMPAHTTSPSTQHTPSGARR